MKKLLLYIFILNFTFIPVFGYELDMSVDEQIKKKYDTTKLEQDVLNNSVKTEQKSSSKNNVLKTVRAGELDFSPSPLVITKAERVYSKKIPARTTFRVKSAQNITGYSPKGTKVTFTTTENVYKKTVTIPAGTKFSGEIVNSHPPQPAGNGALLVLKINSVTYNCETYHAEGKITKAEAKKIFFNNIKGKRQYLSGIGKQIDKGGKFYKKTRSVSSKMADNPILIILSPIPPLVGIAGYTGCAVLSPVTALTTKGGNLTLPAGSEFEIKLTDSVYVR